MATSYAGLLGPPELRSSQPASAAAALPPVDPFRDLSDAGLNSSRPPTGLTENLSPTFLSSGDPCLDFFFQVVPGTAAETVAALLADAWAKDPLTALKLACHLRGVRGTGKSDREGFYACALWLHRHHPKTLAHNLPSIAQFGYLKDLPEILHRLLAGDDCREKARAARPLLTASHRRRLSRSQRRRLMVIRDRRPSPEWDRQLTREGTWKARVAAEAARVQAESERAAELRHRNRVEAAARAVERYSCDPAYRFLHDRTAELFAGLLADDLRHLSSGQRNRISLAAKWCPSLDSSFDRSILLCEAVARRLFPKDSDDEYKDLEDAHYAYRVRDRLRKSALVPLRRALELPEVFIGAGQWNSLLYDRVASVAMENYNELFLTHDEERFAEYLERVKKGTAKIPAGALLPHEILAPAARGGDDVVAELQWRRMVEDLRKKGSLKNCIAVCDVSGRMAGIPMDVCAALGLLISELSEEPWRGRVITFSKHPQLHKIEGSSIREKTEFVRQMGSGLNTDFEKVFDRILDVAAAGGLAAESMVRRVFVFTGTEFDVATFYKFDVATFYKFHQASAGSGETDMELDQASANSWETKYEAICRKFREKGYGEAVPEVVFWNLRDSLSTPELSSQKGVALVSGFSKSLMKVFLEGDGVLSPVAVMEGAIAGEEYEKLAVFD